MMLSEAIDAATAIIGGYPNGGANAGDSYIGALAATLMAYPRQVALCCADYPRKPGRPLRGVGGTCKFLPTPADLITWCERESEPLRCQREREMRIEQLRTERAADDAREQERPSRLTYAELKAKYGDGDGWGIDAVEAAARMHGLSADDLIAICGEEEWRKIPKAAQ